MKKNMKTFAIGIIAAAIALSSCTKEGPVGPQGTNGTNGTNGAANVINKFIVAMPWVWDATNNEWYYDYAIGTDNYTSAIMAYVGIGTSYSALPYYNVSNNTTTSFNVTATNIRFIYYNGSSTLTTPTSMVINLIVIPPAMVKPGLNIHSYEEVKKAYNL